MFEDAKKQLEKAIPYAQIDTETWEKLQYPDRIIQSSIPMRHDNGTLKIYKSYKCQYSNLLGIYKGGIRFHENINRDHIEALSFWMTFKCALLKLPLGGSKSGICVNPSLLSHRELERLSKAYIATYADFIGSDIDVGAPDIGTDEKVMGWMYSEYRKIKGGHPKGILTGKPISLGGIEGRSSATGYGGWYVMEIIMKYLNEINILPKDAKIAIQGFGKVGYWFAEKCYKKGLTIVAISNEFGGLYNENGLNPILLQKYLQQNEKLGGQGAEITNEELLFLEVDILALAAIENVITKENVEQINAKSILELANGPVTLEADFILEDRKIIVIPDILANSGGVCISYLEWVQNNMGYYWTFNEVAKKMEEHITRGFRDTLSRSKKYKIDMRKAAMVLAVERVVEAFDHKGIWP